MDKDQNAHLAQSTAPIANQHRPSNGRFIVAFLAGMVFSAALLGIWALATGQLSIGIRSAPRNVSPATYTPPKLPGKTKVTEEDLQNYKDAKDCSTLSDYATYTLAAANRSMQTIDLSGGVITVGTATNGTTYYYWKALPKVVDGDCSEIKLSDIEAGDTLNIYEGKNAGGSGDYTVKLVQKVQ